MSEPMRRVVISRPPPPDLQALVQRHGGFDNVPITAWQRHDRETARWKRFIGEGLHYYAEDIIEDLLGAAS